MIIQPGDIVRVKIHCIIKYDYFNKDSKTQKFYDWMNVVMKATESIKENNLNNFIKYKGCKDVDDFNTKFIICKPVEVWFEAAISLKPFLSKIIEPKLKITNQIALNEKLWKILSTRTEADKTIAFIDKNADFDFINFAYTSRTEIKHQVWNWNGRLDESDLLIKDDKLDPEDEKTTTAMQWEAWSFSDTPDFSALVQETNLLAFRYDNKDSDTILPQDVFTDLRPGEKKALYYRFSAILHSRYELLGESFKFSIESKKPVDGVFDKWKRHLRKCTRKIPMPKPSIRFVIPLTKSIEQCKEDQNITAASLLVVLDDRWFTEAGLAEQFELGIEALKNPNLKDCKNVDEYLSAGNDPILTGESLGSMNSNYNSTRKYPYILKEEGKNDRLIFDAKGPAGLTFDFAAQTPKLKGCAFVVEIPDLTSIINLSNKDENITNKLKPWSLMQIAIRRTLREPLCEKGIAVSSINSEWTAKEWVQFLPSVDSFIPTWWRKTVALENFISLKISGQNLDITNSELKYLNALPTFDDVFESFHQRFLVLTQKVYDIGGQPCEKYIGTYFFRGADNSYSLNHPEFIMQSELPKNMEGYIRVLLVRKAKDVKDTDEESQKPIWNRLFGESAEFKPDMQDVQNDPTAALPLVSERIPYKVI